MEKIPITKPFFAREDIEEVLRNTQAVLESGMLMQGKFVEEFEREFAKAAGTQFARAVNSGTSALQAILNYYDVKGAEVLVPVNTFLATPNAVLFEGGIPVFVDIDATTLCIDFEDMKRRVTQKTKGVIVVHLAGLITPAINEIRSFCKERGLFLIEDAAHAHGSRHLNKPAGSWGEAAAFSFLATKVITSGGEGGMVTTENEEIAKRVVSLRFHGEDSKRGIQDRIGYSWRMTELQAIVGITQTRRLSEIVMKRMEIAKRYDEAFARLSNLRTITVPAGSLSAYYKYPLTLLGSLDRIHVKERLEKEFGVTSGTSYWPPCHLQPAYQKAFGYREGMYPVAEQTLNKTISLPMHCHLTNEEIGRVIEAVKKIAS